MKMANPLKYTCLFGGGAIRGLAYIGTIRALEELDVELLVTGKRGLSEKYQERKESTRKSESKTSSKNAPKKTTVKQSYTMKPAKTKEKGRISAFWVFVGAASIVSLVLLLFIASV